MRINFIITGLLRVGGIRIILEYATRLSGKGHAVNIYYPIIAYNFHTEKGVLYFLKRLYWSIGNIINSFRVKAKFDVEFEGIKLLPAINNLWVPDADVIVASEWPVVFDVYRLKESKGRKFYFIQGHETHFSNSDFIGKAIKMKMNKIVVSNYLNKLLEEVYNEDSIVVNNSVNMEFFNNPDKYFNKERKQVSFIDSAAKVKRMEDIITAIDKLHEQYPKIDFVAFGFKKSGEIPSYVNYVLDPNDKEIRDIYCASDIFIGASREEGFYLAPAEAMACKCAVVVTKVGAVPEFSSHMKSAIHIDTYSPHQIFNAVKLLLENDILLKEISIAGFEEVRSKLKWEDSVNKIESIFSRNLQNM